MDSLNRFWANLCAFLPLDVRKYFFSHWAVSGRNLLDDVTANAKTVNSFVSRLEKVGQKMGDYLLVLGS